ncbi:hypothetical protein Hanom_Chr14g01305301 [Helianthus anomalus]
MFGNCKLTFSHIGIYVCKYKIQNIVFLIQFHMETMLGSGGGGYMRANDFNGAYASQASWTREPVSDAGSSRKSERRYGT